MNTHARKKGKQKAKSETVKQEKDKRKEAITKEREKRGKRTATTRYLTLLCS